MKKIFTLLFTVGMFAVAQAQPGNRDNRQNDQRDFDKDIDITVNHRPNDNDDRFGNDRFGNDRFGNDRFGNDDRFGNSEFSNERKMRMQIALINREFDYKSDRVRNSFFLSRWEKQRQLRFLEERRQQEIRRVYIRFKYSRGYNDRGYNDRDFPERRHY